jgi:hypothetical protein
MQNLEHLFVAYTNAAQVEEAAREAVERDPTPKNLAALTKAKMARWAALEETRHATQTP